MRYPASVVYMLIILCIPIALVVLPKVKAYMGKSPFTAYFNLIGLTVLVPLLVIIFVIMLLVRHIRRRRRIRALPDNS